MLSGIYSANSGFLASLSALENRINQTNEEISSGIRVNQASDDPGAVSAILNDQQQISEIKQAQTNLQTANSTVTTADQALQTASQLLDQLTSIASQGSSLSATNGKTVTTYALDSGHAFTQLAMGTLASDTETLAFTTTQGSVSVTLDHTETNTAQAIAAINAKTAALGVIAVASPQTANGIAFRSATTFSVTDTLTGAAGGGGTEGVFGQTVAASGSNTYTPASPASVNSTTPSPALAQEVYQIQQQLVSLANTTFNGQYVFGGDASTTAPYTFTGTGASGVTQNSSGSSTDSISDANGDTIVPLMSAQQIFDVQNAGTPATPATGNIFNAVWSLYQALQGLGPSGNVQNDVQSAAGLIKSGVTQLGIVTTHIGNTEDWIQQAQDNASQSLTTIQTSLSSLRDADIPTEATQLTMDQTALQAALAAHASFDNKSLFSYLG